MADDWDLNAVVRSCNSTIAADPPASLLDDDNETLSFLASLTFQDENDHFSSPQHNNNNIGQQPHQPTNNNASQELQRFFYKPHFSHNPTTVNTTITTTIATTNSIIPNSLFPDYGVSSGQQQQMQYQPLNGAVLPSAREQEVRRAEAQKQNESSIMLPRPVPPGYVPMSPRASASPKSNLQILKPKKRKNQQKKLVCTVTKENLYADLWAWRKYGQKPIKGSPYPRNYYRCSSMKGCSARKQVERSQNNPELFILTYTGDHAHPRPNHRNSLAGTSRSKLLPPPPRPPPVACSSPQSAGSSRQLSPTTPLHAIAEDEITAAANLGGYGGDNYSETNKTNEPMDEDEEEEGILIPNVVVSGEFLYDMLM